jgi:hypothetical protein
LPKLEYVYEVYPSNFYLLPDQRRNALVDNFRAFLNALSSDLRITVMRTERPVEIGGQQIVTSYYRFFMESGEAIDHLLDASGIRFQPLAEAPALEPVKVFTKHMALKGGILMRTFTVYALPESLVEGFISELYGVAERIVLYIRPLPPDIATSKMRSYKTLLQSLADSDAARGRRPRDEVLMKLRMAQEAYEALASGSTRLFEVTFNICAAGKNGEELSENSKRVKQALQARMLRADCPAFMQYGMALGVQGKRLYMDTQTLGAFYPFVSADLIETPGGIFLGVNRLTGAPVIYDPWLRMNYSILIVGKSGSGKSFLSKMLLSRLAIRNRDLAFFIIDPEAEYVKVGKLLEARIVNVSSEMNLGIDPVRAFQSDKDTAAGIVSALVNIEDRKEYSELRTLIGRSRDIIAVYQHADRRLKRKIRPLIDGSDSYLVMGKPMEFSRRMVFNLKPLHGGSYAGEQISLRNASLLIFAKIWNMLNSTEFIPLHVPRIVIVDEVWLYTSIQPAARFLESVARMGRKRNIAFILNTQRAMDILEGSGGKALLENCATKILLRQDESAVGVVGEAFALSEAEKDAVLSFQPGQGLLIAENIHVPVDFLATKEEHTIFSTKPTEVAAK